MKKLLEKLGIKSQKDNAKTTEKVGSSQKTAKQYSKAIPDNPYDATQKATELSKVYEDAEKSLQHRPYAERSKPKSLILKAFRYGYPVISLIFAFCAVWLIAMYATEDITLEYMRKIQFGGVLVLGVFGAVTIEVLKSYASIEVFKYKIRSNVILLVFCTLGSIIYTSSGSYLLSLHLTDKTDILTEQTAVQSDSVKTQYAEQIALLKAQIQKDNEVLTKYKAGNYRTHYASERLAQSMPKLNELLQLQKSDLEGLVKEKEQKIQSSFTKNHAYALGSIFLVLLAEIGYVLTIQGIIQIERKIKIENANHNKVQIDEPIEVESPEKMTIESVAVQLLLNQIQGGQNLQLTPISNQIKPENTGSKVGFEFTENGSDDTKNVKNDTSQRETSNEKRNTKNVGEGNRICKNCNETYTYRHWNQKYCSDKCRIDNWEKRTGKTFKKGKKGGVK